MNQIVKIKYKRRGDVVEDYFIKTKMGLIPINIRSGEFIQIIDDNVISEENVKINTKNGRFN